MDPDEVSKHREALSRLETTAGQEEFLSAVEGLIEDHEEGLVAADPLSETLEESYARGERRAAILDCGLEAGPSVSEEVREILHALNDRELMDHLAAAFEREPGGVRVGASWHNAWPAPGERSVTVDFFIFDRNTRISQVGWPQWEKSWRAVKGEEWSVCGLRKRIAALRQASARDAIPEGQGTWFVPREEASEDRPLRYGGHVFPDLAEIPEIPTAEPPREKLMTEVELCEDCGRPFAGSAAPGCRCVHLHHPANQTLVERIVGSIVADLKDRAVLQAGWSAMTHLERGEAAETWVEIVRCHLLS